MEDPPITIDSGLEKRRIGLKRGVLIVLVAAGAAVVVHEVASLAWALSFDRPFRPLIGISVYSQARIAMIGAIMAWAAIFVWRRPGVVGGLCSAVFVLAMFLMDLLLAVCWVLLYGTGNISFPFFTLSIIGQALVYSAAVWSIPLLSSVLPWRIGAFLGALILAAYQGFTSWKIWTTFAPEAGVNSQLTWSLGAGILSGTLPVLVGFVAASLMLPHGRSRRVMPTTVPTTL